MTAAEIRLLVMLQADGSIQNKERGGGVTFAFTKERKVTRCREILDAVGMEYAFHPRTTPEGNDRFYIGAGKVPPFIEEYLGGGMKVVGAQEKLFGPWVLQMSRAQIDVFTEEVWHWDAVTALKTQYSTTVEQNADWVQTLLVLSGVRTNQYMGFENVPGRQPIHILGVKRTEHNRITARSTYEIVHDFDDMVYCLEVPTTWVVTRRNGKVTISGNTPKTGRISSSKPINAQNYPLIAKHYLTAGPGNLLVGADFDQIELRLVSLVAGCKVYLEEFAKKNSDPHSLTATLIYGDAFTKLVPKSPGWKKLRTIAKSFTYAVIYGAEIVTIYETLSAAEDQNTGKLLFPDLTLEQVRAIYNTWTARVPEVKLWWEKIWNECKTQGCVIEPVYGRRRDFPQFERNESINFPIQGGAAAIMSIALQRLVQQIPFDFAGPYTGLVNQCHDAVTFEVPENRAKEVAEILKEHMAVDIPHMPGVRFLAKPDIGWRWSEV